MSEIINSASPTPVHELLSADTKKLVYVIPKYQREYSWMKYQWEDLIRDIQEEDPGHGHFLGTIICMNATRDVTKEIVLELIDGQQRLTTLSLLLAVLFVELRDRRAEFEDDDDRMTILLNLKLRLVADGRPRLRLQKQGNNDDDFRWLLKNLGLLKDESLSQPSWWGVRRIAKAFRFFQDELRGELEGMTPGARLEHVFDLVDRVSNSIVVKLEVKDHASAYTLFESLNNRGMPLSPIDLIKNSLLMRADRLGSARIDEAYEQWRNILTNLGDNPNEQERFLRYYYNVFEPLSGEAAATPIATKSNLIRLYEKYLDQGVDDFLRDVSAAAHQYGRIIDTVNLDGENEALDEATTRLQRAQGAPGNALLLYLLVRQQQLGLTDDHVVQVADLVTNFFVRRNLTSLPATYELPRMFKTIVHELADLQGEEVVHHVRESLLAHSSTDESFRAALSRPIYEDNAAMCRFIIATLAEQGMTKETRTDLWRRAGSANKQYYVWTIEHIFPQGSNIPRAWQDMMGGPEAAASALESQVHRLGNLTLTGYNSSLGNKSFIEKRDRVDQRGNAVGYRNGLNLNRELAMKDSWNVTQIDQRTEQLVERCLKVFAF